MGRLRVLSKITIMYIAVVMFVISVYIGLDGGKVRTLSIESMHDAEQNNTARTGISKSMQFDGLPPAFKIYVYDLPAAFNENILKCHEKRYCFDTSEAGYGKIFSVADGAVFRHTWHGLLELTIHQRLLQSRHRTHDPNKADAFYIPFYSQMLYRCTDHADGVFRAPIYSHLYQNITKMPYFAAGKPHFTTLGQPEDFAGLAYAPEWLTSILYMVLEIGHNYRATYPTKKLYTPLVAPYQAIGHFNQKDGGKYMETIINNPRKVWIFLAGGGRPNNFSTENDFRNKIVQQMATMTTSSFRHYFRLRNGHNHDVIMFDIPRPCKLTQSPRILEWMQNSLFCLQPPGDTATRKSFYDAVISGCIPVIFELPYMVTRVTYPFDTSIDYTSFTVTVPTNASFLETLNRFKDKPDEVSRLQKNLARVAKLLQYNDISTPDVDADAFHLLIQQVAQHFGFVDKLVL